MPTPRVTTDVHRPLLYKELATQPVLALGYQHPRPTHQTEKADEDARLCNSAGAL